MNTVLKINELTKVYDKHINGESKSFHAVDKVSFTLEKGESLGIVGESGCGKSTLAKMLCRLIDPTEGSISLFGEDITKLKGNKLKKVYENIQMVFQNPKGSFDPRRTLGYSIGESLKNAGVPKEDINMKVKQLLNECGLEESMADRYPYEVSGGQCQRAAIARALSQSPTVLICDEATSALDVTVQKQVIDLLKRLKAEEGLSFIFICHNLALVQDFCDKIIVMSEGKIVEYGETSNVILNPQSDYTKALIDAIF